MKRERESVCEYEISMRTNKKMSFFFERFISTVFFVFYLTGLGKPNTHTHTQAYMSL